MEADRQSEGVLRPTPEAALAAWSELVTANREQIERVRESQPATDFYRPRAQQFRPGRAEADDLDWVLDHAQPEDTWLDIGAGGGRIAVPVAARVRSVHAVEPSEAMREVMTAAAAAAGLDNLHIHDARWPPSAEAGSTGVTPPGEAGSTGMTPPGEAGSTGMTPSGEAGSTGMTPSGEAGSTGMTPSGVGAPIADVSVASHVLYDQEDLGGFLDAMEAHTRRTCIVVVGDRAPSGAFEPLWSELYGEPPRLLPARRELLAVLGALDRPFEVRTLQHAERALVDREEAQRWARSLYWLQADSERDQRATALLEEHFGTEDGQFAVPSRISYVSVVNWPPPA